MTRWIMLSLLGVVMFSGCTAKEFNAGVDDAADGVVRVIRGTNN